MTSPTRSRGPDARAHLRLLIAFTLLIAPLPARADTPVSGSEDALKRVFKLLKIANKQVYIKSRFIEIEKTNLDELPLIWTPGVGFGQGARTEPIPVIINLPLDPSLRSADEIRRGAGDFFEDHKHPGSLNLDNVFTGRQFQVIRRALKPGKGRDLISEPSILEHPGRDAEFDPADKSRNFVIVDIYEVFGDPLSTGPDLTEFEGFINYGSPITSSPSPSSSPSVVPDGNGIPQPVVSSRTIRTAVTMPDGETTVLGGLIEDTPYFTSAEEPLREDLGTNNLLRFGTPDITLTVGPAYRVGPDLTIGNTPFGDFDNDWLTTEAAITLHLGECSKLGAAPFISLYGGGGSGRDEPKGDSNAPGTLSDITGLNVALTPVTAWRNRNLSLDTCHLGTTVGVIRQLEQRRSLVAWAASNRSRTGLRDDQRHSLAVWAGLNLEHTGNDYRLTELVSGGGPFFPHTLDFEQDTTFIGPKFGVSGTRPFARGAVTTGIWVAPGYQFYELDATQSGTALPQGRVRDRDNGFNFKAGLNLGFTFPLGRKASFTVGGYADLVTDKPDIAYPTAGSTPLRADTGFGWDAGAAAAVKINLGDPDDEFISPRFWRKSTPFRY